jgi:hypothetical protein
MNQLRKWSTYLVARMASPVLGLTLSQQITATTPMNVYSQTPLDDFKNPPSPLNPPDSISTHCNIGSRLSRRMEKNDFRINWTVGSMLAPLRGSAGLRRLRSLKEPCSFHEQRIKLPIALLVFFLAVFDIVDQPQSIIPSLGNVDRESFSNFINAK